MTTKPQSHSSLNSSANTLVFKSLPPIFCSKIMNPLSKDPLETLDTHLFQNDAPIRVQKISIGNLLIVILHTLTVIALGMINFINNPLHEHFTILAHITILIIPVVVTKLSIVLVNAPVAIIL